MDKGFSVCAILLCCLITQITALTEAEIDRKIEIFQNKILNSIATVNVHRVEEGSGDFGNSRDYTAVDNIKRVVIQVRFSTPFIDPPVVFFRVYGMIVDTKHMLRQVAYARNITQSGFEAVCETWDDTQMDAVWYHWIALSR